MWIAEAAPRLCRPFLFRNSPRKKIRMRSGKARGRDARYSARGGIQHWHSIGAYERVVSHHARGAHRRYRKIVVSRPRTYGIYLFLLKKRMTIIIQNTAPIPIGTMPKR